MKTIVVNNPAARSGGALTILKEFLEKITTLNCTHKFIVIVSLRALKKYETDNVKIYIIDSQNFKERILWDNFKLKKYLKTNNVVPDLFISLQNTGVKLEKNIPQIIYYHQLLSILNLEWNIFNKNQRIYWMYKNIYPIFIKLHLNKAIKVIVQTEWVKNKFSKKFNYASKDILLMRPKVKEINLESIKLLPKNKFRIFYPAAPHIYKNHKIIIEALKKIKNNNKNIFDEIECIFTFNNNENLGIYSLIRKYELENSIKLIGEISYEKVLEYYKSSDLMVFPSYLETFGLPLIEAQNFNLDILVVDLPYSKEVLKDYKRVEFIQQNDIEKWSEKIKDNLVRKYEKKL